MKISLRFLGQIALWSCFAVLTGCSSSVSWDKTASGTLDPLRGGKVVITSACQAPEFDLTVFKTETQKQVNQVLTGNPDAPNAYQINIAINQYDEGNATARFMLIGLGQMHLGGTIEVKEGDTSNLVCSGNLKKDYCVGGVLGGLATMSKDVLIPAGKDIAAALEKKKKK